VLSRTSNDLFNPGSTFFCNAGDGTVIPESDWYALVVNSLVGFGNGPAPVAEDEIRTVRALVALWSPHFRRTQAGLGLSQRMRTKGCNRLS
jgi:hypothetical protein